MPYKPKERQYRTLESLITKSDTTGAEENKSYIVEGYATTFTPYELYRDEFGNVVYEHFTPEAFDGVDMSDVIMQYDHTGRVFARTSNNTLKLDVDDTGLKITADLGRTESSRALYDDIAAGLITKMSWGFSYDTTQPEFDEKTNTITWGAGTVRKIYDVSAVSIPANNDTEISARALTDRLINRADNIAGENRDESGNGELQRRNIIIKILKSKLED